MQSMSNISVPSVGEVIRGRIAELGISQTELAARVGEHFQTISAIISEKQTESMKEKRHIILEKIKANGGFWSYQGIPDSLDDDAVIEAALVHLDLEDLPLLLGIWSKAHIKRVWKERLVSQGKRMNVLNYILAVKLFGINNPDKYISRYAHVY